jgi:shikimate kinase
LDEARPWVRPKSRSEVRGPRSEGLYRCASAWNREVFPLTSDLGARTSKHLVLVGLPGAGKSTIGALVATQAHRPFLDFDVEIARRYGAPVSKIFSDRGEAFFRGLERMLTMELVDAQAMILAPGGGWITQTTTTALLRGRARIIYLQVSPSVALARLGGQVVDRPLLRVDDPLAKLEELFQARRQLYERAEHVVNTETLSPQELVDFLVGLALQDEQPIG